MFKNYFKIAFRNLQSNKLYSAINIFGLAIGISSSLIIFLIVQYDFGFDKFEKGGDRIYRVVVHGDFNSPEVPFQLGDAVKNQVTGLDVVAPFTLWSEFTKVSIAKPKKAKPAVFKNESTIVFTDKQYFKLINYKWLAGSPESSLSGPYQTVLTEQNAKRFFSGLPLNEIPGKEISFNDTILTTVTGIVANLKQNTDFNFQTFVSLATEKSLHPEKRASTQLFIKLSKNTDPKHMINQIAEVYHLLPGTNSTRHPDLPLKLQPLSDLHFSTVYDSFGQRKAYMPELYGLMAIAGILLLLACINFINLTTAQSSQRAKEIGIRKTLGSSRKQLIFQFLSETFILTMIATFISIIFAPLLLKAFSDFIPKGLHFNIQQPGVILFLFITTALVSLFSGIYPALILSSFKPVSILKNQLVAGKANTGRLFFRKTSPFLNL